MARHKEYATLQVVIRIVNPGGSGRSEWSIDMDKNLVHLALYDRFNQPYATKELSFERFYQEFQKASKAVDTSRSNGPTSDGHYSDGSVQA